MTSTPTESVNQRTVTDETGRLYELSESLGAGGQGAVYLCKGKKLAVKLLQAPTAEVRERLRKQIAFVRRLPLAELHLARPIAVLAEPQAGYVMEFMSGMVSLTGMCSPPPSNVTSWHLSNGSLRRRLRILGTLADRMHLLHSRGLAYGDLSPANVFVSAVRDGSEVWMIDCDNICYAASPCTSTYFTPRYGAPELVRGKSGFNTMSDAYAFAVLVYEILTLTHPLLGRAVIEGPPEEEMAALRGERPWVESIADDVNRNEFGIRPSSVVLSKNLQALCEKTFGPGLNDQQKRPGLREWRDVLHWADAATVVCASCGGSFYHIKLKCPWCNAGRPTYARITLAKAFPELEHDRAEIVDRYSVSKESIAESHRQSMGQLTVSAGEKRIMNDFHLTLGDPEVERIDVSFAMKADTLTFTNIACENLFVLQNGMYQLLEKTCSAALSLGSGSGVIAARFGRRESRHILMKVTREAGIR